MLLIDLEKRDGLKKKSKRRGRGNSSGRGNYSTRGLKGQGQRSGFSNHPGFEGGQTPLNLRLPKLKGFKRYFKLVKNYQPVNLDRLDADKRIESNITITKEHLVNLGYLNDINQLVKVLGSGDITKTLNFKGLDKYSVSAIQKIEKSGGKIID